MLKYLSLLAVSALFCTTTQAQSDDLSPMQRKVVEAMEMDYRTEAEIARDENRDPVRALEFMGLESDMTVIEFIPAAQAWYAKILAPVLVESGEHYVIDSPRTFDRWGDLLDHSAFESTHTTPVDLSYNRSEGRYELGELNLDVENADLFLNIREYHNFNPADKARLNQAAFDALKPGGRYVIIDHSRRHMQPETRIMVRREDPVQVILEVQDVGFELEKSSDMFFKPNDKLDLEVGHESVSGQTDRFFLVFKKPK